MILTPELPEHYRLAAEVWLVRHGESEVNVRSDPVYSGANTWSELTSRARCMLQWGRDHSAAERPSS